MTYTEAELSALRRAYASGAVEVTYDGKTIRYDSGAALLRRIREIEGAMTTAAPRTMAVFTTFRRD